MQVYHLGHSLVGRNMPAMLAQLAGAGHGYASQLGWGASLRDHWEPAVPVNGFDVENAHDRFRAAGEAIESGLYDAVVFTEMVEIADAIRYHDSAKYLTRWAQLAKSARPDVRLYLYETWHNTDDPSGWLDRIDSDLAKRWEADIAFPAARALGVPIHIIPAGQVIAAVVQRITQAGGIGALSDRDALFAQTPEGGVDTIHLDDLGNYLVALTHFATLYHRSPVGLPLALAQADGTAAKAPDAQAGLMMQETVWDVVRRYQQSGVAA